MLNCEPIRCITQLAQQQLSPKSYFSRKSQAGSQNIEIALFGEKAHHVYSKIFLVLEAKVKVEDIQGISCDSKDIAEVNICCNRVTDKQDKNLNAPKFHPRRTKSDLDQIVIKERELIQTV